MSVGSPWPPHLGQSKVIGLFSKKFTAPGTPELRLYVLYFHDGSFTYGVLRDYVEVHLDRFAHISGVIADDQVHLCDSGTTGFLTVLSGYFYYLFRYRIFMHKNLLSKSVDLQVIL